MQLVSNELQFLRHWYLTTVLKRTTVIVLVIMYAFARKSVWPDLVNCICIHIRSSFYNFIFLATSNQNINAKLCQNMFTSLKLLNLIVPAKKNRDGSKQGIYSSFRTLL